MQQKVTVITVCFNAENELKRTVESVLSQDYGNLELVIVDGGSKDHTKDYLLTLPKDRIKWISEPDKGIYDAMNKGVRMSTGDWIIFLNSADTFTGTSVVSQVFDGITPDNDIIYGDVMKDGIVKKAEEVHNSHRMFFCHQCVFVRKKLLFECPFDLKYRMSADFKFFKLMVLRNKNFVKKDIPIANFDQTGISNTHRSAGIAENIRIIFEVDSMKDILKLAPRMIFQYMMCRLRGK